MPDPRELLDSYVANTYLGDPANGPWPDDPDGGEMRFVAALRSVLDAVDTWRHEAWQPAQNGGDYTTGYVAGALAATFAHEQTVRRVIAEKLGGGDE